MSFVGALAVLGTLGMLVAGNVALDLRATIDKVLAFDHHEHPQERVEVEDAAVPVEMIEEAREDFTRAKRALLHFGPHSDDRRMLRVGDDVEDHEVAELEGSSCPQAIEHADGRTYEAQVDVLRGAPALDTKLDDDATLEDHAVAELPHDAGEDPVEYEELTSTREVHAARSQWV